jgi:hypothetical protein
MAERPRDDDREQRIDNEIIVDAYGPEEQAMGWYYYCDGRRQRVARRLAQRVHPAHPHGCVQQHAAPVGHLPSLSPRQAEANTTLSRCAARRSLVPSPG